MPSATGMHGKGGEVVAEAVAELDPALAEVHQVDESDRGDRQHSPGHETPPAQPDDGRNGQEVGRAGEDQAHADGIGAKERAGHSSNRIESRSDAAAPAAPVAGSPSHSALEQRRIRRPEQHDGGVLGHVARVLDGPFRVVQAPVGPILVAVEVLVRGMEDVSRGGHVIGEQERDRDRRSKAGRDGTPPVGASAADEQEERRAEDGGQPRERRRTEQHPGHELAWLDEAQQPSTPSPAFVGRGVQRGRDGEEQEGGGNDVGEEPSASQHRRVPRHGAEPVERRGQGGCASRRRHSPEHPPAEPHVEAPQHGRDEGTVGGQSEERHEGQQHHRGQGRERDEGIARSIGEGEDILEVVVPEDPVVIWERDGGSTVQPGVRLPHEVVIEVGTRGVAEHVDRDRESHECSSHPGGMDALEVPGRRAGGSAPGRRVQGRLGVLRYTAGHPRRLSLEAGRR